VDSCARTGLGNYHILFTLHQQARYVISKASELASYLNICPLVPDRLHSTCKLNFTIHRLLENTIPNYVIQHSSIQHIN
jgi:hypothetical protein